MRQENFHFELRDNTDALATALNDIIIKRFKDDSRTNIEKKINVRFVYGPKKRILYDIINAAKATTLPVVALDLKGFSHDTSRIFNKNGEFFDTVISGDNCAQYLTPTPIKLNYGITIITRYRTDIEQIISNIIPHCNPYFVISIKVPPEFKLLKDQEIREIVTWSGNINIEHPDPINKDAKSIYTATTDFTVNGWLFKPEQPAAKPIYEIDANFTDNLVEDWDDVGNIHVESYPFIDYVCVNGIPQTTLNPEFIPGISNIKDMYISKEIFDISSELTAPTVSLIGNGLNHDNTYVLNGSTYVLKKLGEYKKFDLKNISTNRTPKTIIRKGILGLDITNNIEFTRENIAQFKLFDNLDVGTYTITTFNESGVSNVITFNIV
jgi:hypothetical protein